MSDLSLLLRGYADAVDDQFRPVDADALRRREPPPPPALEPRRLTGRVVPFRSRPDGRFLLAAAAAVVMLLIGGIAFAHRGTRDPAAVDTTGNSNVITGPSTSSSTSIPPCPPDAPAGCVDRSGTGTSVPGTLPDPGAPGSSVPGTVLAGGPPASDQPSPPVAVVEPTTSSPTSIVLVPRTTTTRPSTTSSSSTTTTTAPPSGLLRGSFVCTGVCSGSFGTQFFFQEMFPTARFINVNIVVSNATYTTTLEPGFYEFPVKSRCGWTDELGSPRGALQVVAGSTYNWAVHCDYAPLVIP
jgi:hypothetical protein